MHLKVESRRLITRCDKKSANMNLYQQQELSVSSTLRNLSKVSNSLDFIQSIKRVYQFSDEPKLFQYSANLHSNSQKTDGHTAKQKRASGASLFSDEVAFLKCLAESIERHCCTVYKQSEFVHGSYGELKHKAIDPQIVNGLSPEQRKQFSLFNFSDSTSFSWVWTHSLIDMRRKLIPAQLVYYNYKLLKGEKYIYPPISTGAAGGSCTASAIVRGILEVVERDSYTVTYLNKLPVPQIELKSIRDNRIGLIRDILRRYHLQLAIIDVTTDLGIPCFTSILTDDTGIGAGTLVGLKASINPIDAIVGAFEEAVRARSWIRIEYEDHNETSYKNLDPKDISTAEQRGAFWYPRSRRKHLNFWLNSKPRPFAHSRINFSQNHGQILKNLLTILRKKGHRIYYVDITLPSVKAAGYKIVKVVIPSLHPHSLIERFTPLGGKRLREAPKLMGYKVKSDREFNSFPNPFI